MIYYVYSTHKTREAAEMALEDYFAEGIVSLGEGPKVKRHGARWAVMFRG